MNSLNVFDSRLTMTSLEISELTGVRHDNVKRTVETLAKRGVIEFPQSEEIPTATRPNKDYETFVVWSL